MHLETCDAEGVRRSARRHPAGGLTLPEVLVIMAIIGLFLALALPQAGNHIRSSRVRLAADTLANDLQSTRILAVTSRRPQSLELVGTAPAVAYVIPEIDGTEKTVRLPDGVRISSTRNFPIVYTSMGALQGPAASARVRGAITATRAHEFTITVSRTGRLSKDFDGDAVPE